MSNLIEISLDSNNQDYEITKNRLIIIINDFIKSYSNIDFTILSKSLHADLKTNYIISYNLDGNDKIIILGILLYVVDNDNCIIEFIFSDIEYIKQNILKYLDKKCIEKKYQLKFSKSILNIDNLKLQYYKILKSYYD